MPFKKFRDGLVENLLQQFCHNTLLRRITTNNQLHHVLNPGFNMVLKTSMKKRPKSVDKVNTSLKKAQHKQQKGVEKTKLPQKTELNLEYNSDYDLNQDKVLDFVKALLKVHGGGKLSSDLLQEETPVNLQISGVKIAKENRKHLLKM